MTVTETDPGTYRPSEHHPEWVRVDAPEEPVETAGDLSEFVPHRSGKSRSRFLAGMAHDLRNPLHGIISYAGFGLKKAIPNSPDTEKLRHYFGNIRNAGYRLQAVLNDMVELARLDSDQVKFTRKPWDYAGIVNGVISELQSTIAPEGSSVVLTSPMAPATVQADTKYLALAIRQLLTVSLGCQEGPGRITLTIETDRLVDSDSKAVPAVRLTLENPRLHFTAEELTIALNLLRYIENTDPRLRSAGLKIEICRRIVIAHDGRIWGETAVADGGRFVIVLPLVNA